MSIDFDFWKLMAGLGIFLFGMHLIEDSVKTLSGRTFRRIIRTYTNGKLRSIGSGALVTALLQSSSAVSLMVLAMITVYSTLFHFLMILEGQKFSWITD